MEFKTGKCPRCGNYNVILPSNNPLCQSICIYCITSTLKYDNVENADFFCRTYNIPFEPKKWIELATKFKEKVFEEYISYVAEEYKEEKLLFYTSSTSDLWGKINKEWNLSLTHEELIDKITPLKEGYILRNKIKWGTNYTFEELINLENLFINTLKSNDITNPMQIDAIKKACKLSISLDRAIVANEESKVINDLSKAYQNFIKTARIDEIINSANQEVISNFAEFVDFIEKKGFKLDYYDNVSRDIVDESLKIMQNYTKRLVLDSTGLEAVFASIDNSYREEKEVKAINDSYEKVNLADLYEEEKENHSEEYEKTIEDDLQNNELREEDLLTEEEEEDERF